MVSSGSSMARSMRFPGLGLVRQGGGDLLEAEARGEEALYDGVLDLVEAVAEAAVVDSRLGGRGQAADDVLVVSGEGDAVRALGQDIWSRRQQLAPPGAGEGGGRADQTVPARRAGPPLWSA
jgi:hypothetical protein